MTRKPGKIIDTIKFWGKGAPIEVDLRLVKDVNGTFSYCVRHDSPKLSLDDADPNSLRRRVIKLLEEMVIIEWQPVIRVCTDLHLMEHDSWNSSSVSSLDGVEGDRRLSIDIRGFDIGTSVDDKPVYRYRALDGAADRTIQSGSPVRDTMRGDEKSAALIPDTPENREKLASIVAAFTLLSERLSSLLDQPRIGETLANIKLLGLPAPDKP